MGLNWNFTFFTYAVSMQKADCVAIRHTTIVGHMIISNELILHKARFVINF